MITDEQVKAAVTTYHDAYHHHPQIMADMRKALEAYEQSKWVEFDVDDESTYPPVLPERYLLRSTDDKGDLIFEGTCGYVNGNLMYSWREGEERYTFLTVTHWQYLPEFKE